MKVVVAATEEQEEKLDELIKYFYSSVFPQYFDDKEIAEFLHLKILHLPNQTDEPIYTLDGAFRAICSIEVIISILESDIDNKYSIIFNKNVEILKEAGVFFPFSYCNFTSGKRTNANVIFSLYSNATNQFLM
ncbi:DUF5365 family protein [Lederbergia wuyishanensis]|uniref:LAGLIDADG homing endonuclease n=1 Tax=Lederbergia wuyishanensis TaxID=1347903 RepID=A0ABU0CYK7_9BACI|nr:DUF5365 family protein [Lederbergia wuyishanensis]MCJ8005867.1 YhcU family protein [Lederbergia wuyishanensis]MDQ0341232.1 hypothetical protein [Lederbergia wuyishanensis]